MELLSRVLDIEINTITDETSPENTESWDSFNALVMVTELENEFEVHFSMDEITEVTCVKDIKEALKRHDIKLGNNNEILNKDD